MTYYISEASYGDDYSLRENISGNDALAILESIQECHACGTLPSLKAVTENLSKLIPFDHLVSSLVETNNIGNVISHQTLNVSYPKEWLDCYFENKFEQIDPVVIHFFSTFSFSYWNKIPGYMDKNSFFWKMATTFGIKNGCVYGQKNSNSKGGTLFSFSGSEIQHKRHETIIKLIVPHLDIKLRHLTTPPQNMQSTLTKRELDVLNWIKAGKSNWDISVILGISERTVKFHVSSIIRKLNTVNRSQAVAAGIAAGIIDY